MCLIVRLVAVKISAHKILRYASVNPAGHVKTNKINEIISQKIVSLFQILILSIATASFNCLDKKNKERNDSNASERWCSAISEVHGIVMLITSIFLLGVYGACAANEENIEQYIASKRKLDGSRKKIVLDTISTESKTTNDSASENTDDLPKIQDTEF